MSANDTKGAIDPAVIELPMPSEGNLRTLFDLTPAEARLAQRLACGDSVEEVAQITGSPFETTKSRLRYARSRLRELMSAYA